MLSKVTKKRGLILNVSSLSSLAPSIYLTPYVTAKAAINSYSESLHREFGRHGIIIKSFLGGKIKTQTYLDDVSDAPEFDAIPPKVMANNCLDLMNVGTNLESP